MRTHSHSLSEIKIKMTALYYGRLLYTFSRNYLIIYSSYLQILIALSEKASLNILAYML